MDEKHNDSTFSERRASRPYSIIVVGAGIGGLAIGLCMRKTGHDVRILERRHEITEVGAGIQIPPNASRILRRFGVLGEVMKYATVLERNSLRRWKDDEELGSVPLVPDIEENFGAPLAVIHRADLQRILLDAAIDCGCKILEDHEVVDIDKKFLPLTPSSVRRLLVRSRGVKTWMSADVILAADGMNSIVRRKMAIASGHDDQLVPAGELAYRFLLPREAIEHDEKAMALLSKNHGMRYMGPGGHIMAYPLRNNTLYNVVLVRKAESEQLQKITWTTRAKKEDIIKYYRGWCPIIHALISHVPGSGALETPMNNMPPLPTWVKGHIALAGDACHYMLPYVAQGAANALEDAGTLAMAFTCTDRIELALELYQFIRKHRSEWIQASATSNGYTLHLPDGEEQRRRDDSIRAANIGSGTNPDKWNDKKTREFMWHVDVMAETVNEFESLAREAGLKKT
ncbi:putative salicylate hydroxylase [Xylaria bambusicola]|uniref:putative salicylate hydroxylase n=1 Tax=Xylaria bambusicola TaxID=326684 RepID=UPI0020083082|nr:putative salicylate hydroxylase [Xylaria bambusicola]KAI0526403.1 putative salicylate hydroxylase [Xylaria bambusicola]